MKIPIVFYQFLSSVLLTIIFSGCTKDTKTVHLDIENSESALIDKPALYPETIIYNPKTDKFLAGSFREGAIYEIDQDGKSRLFLEDERLNSILGIEIDEKRNRLLVVNADIGSSLRPYKEGPRKLASLGIYDLTNSKLLHFIDLGHLYPEGDHLANGIAIDSDGNAYVTDSFSPVIYKVDVDGNASLFLEDDKFKGEGINLNGIVYHPEGYLLAVKKSDGTLFKIPVTNPENFSEVKSDDKFYGGDGILLLDNENLILVSNLVPGHISESALHIKSTNNWDSSVVVDEIKFGEVYPTTATLKDGKIYAIHSKLNVLNNSPRDKQFELKQQATLQQIGTYK